MTSGAQADRLPIGDLVVGVDGRAVGSVVAEECLVADELAVPVADRPVAATMPGGERDSHLRVDVTQGAHVGALENLHARVDLHARIGLCRRGRQGERGDRCGRRRERA